MTATYKVPGTFNGRWPGVPITVIDIAGHPNSYRLKAICLNCKWEGQIRIAKGMRASRGLTTKGYECPMCECATVEPTTLAGTDSEQNDSRDGMKRYQEERRELLRPIYPPSG